MACGKTLELVRHLQIHAEQRIPTICLKPAIDTRDADVASRSGLRYRSLTIDQNDTQSLRHAIENHGVIGLDEVQFFTADIVPILIEGVKNDKTILVSGLDTDFRGEIFPTALALLALPETNVQRTRAVCSVCLQHNATRTQRLKNGLPVKRNDPIITIEHAGEAITYESRCLMHHIVDES
jgi:thymidine kinase